MPLSRNFGMCWSSMRAVSHSATLSSFQECNGVCSKLLLGAVPPSKVRLLGADRDGLAGTLVDSPGCSPLLVGLAVELPVSTAGLGAVAGLGAGLGAVAGFGGVVSGFGAGMGVASGFGAGLGVVAGFGGVVSGFGVVGLGASWGSGAEAGPGLGDGMRRPTAGVGNLEREARRAPVARDCAGAEVGGRAETETGAETGAGAGACACSAPKAISSLIHSKCPPSVAHMSAVNPSLLSALLSIPCCKNQRRIGTRPRRADACSAVVPPIVRARIMSFPQSRTSSSHAAWLSSATASHRSWTCSLENPLKCIEARKLVIECTGPWFARLAAGIVWIEGIEKEVDRRGWAAGSGTGCGGIAACHDASGTGCGALRPTGWFPWRVGWAAGALCGPTG
eukprot:m.68637 g.68637  ORF g.68637 m.68637 type:complete len:393 (-) comp50013_c0_seq33:2044-3222(-)